MNIRLIELIIYFRSKNADMGVCVPHVSDSREWARVVTVKHIIRKTYNSSTDYR